MTLRCALWRPHTCSVTSGHLHDEKRLTDIRETLRKYRQYFTVRMAWVAQSVQCLTRLEDRGSIPDRGFFF
jgi:hypothetical protein